jgi:ribosomal protein L24
MSLDGDTNLYVSEFGLISISKLFYKMLNKIDFKDINSTNCKSVCLSLEKYNVFTVSFDGKIQKSKIKYLIKNKKVNMNKIMLTNNSYICCSKLNKILYYNSCKNLIVKNKVDKQLLLDTRLSILDQLSNKTFVRNIEVTEDIAWLLGVFIGDGHNKLYGNEISIYSDDKNLTDKIIKIAYNLPNTSINVTKGSCDKISIFGIQARLFFESALEFVSDKTYGGFGCKTYSIEIPSCISNSYSNIRSAFIAGLIDSDGTVCKDWNETSITTCSKNLADQLGCLISTIGGRSCCLFKSGKDNEQDEYKIVFSGNINYGPLSKTILNNLSHSVKKYRLSKWLDKKQKSFITSSVPLHYSDVSYIDNFKELSKQSKVNIKFWLKDKRQLSISSFDKLLSFSKNSSYIREIAPKLIKIKSIDDMESKSQCFEVILDNYDNYVAGNNGLIFI